MVRQYKRFDIDMKILYVEDEISHVELAQRTLEDNLKEKFVLFHRGIFRCR